MQARSKKEKQASAIEFPPNRVVKKHSFFYNIPEDNYISFFETNSNNYLRRERVPVEPQPKSKTKGRMMSV